MTATTTTSGQNVKVKVVASKKATVDGEHQPGPTSLFILGDKNPIRRLFKFLIEWPPFEYTVLVTIVCTCVTMAMEEHLPDGDRTPLAMQLEEAEPVFLGIFLVEAVCKIIANGLVLHPNSYLRDVWNIMDFVVITSAWVEHYFLLFFIWKRCFMYWTHLFYWFSLLTMIPALRGKMNLKILRAIRVLRPLKLVSRVPSQLTNCHNFTMNHLKCICTLTLFFIRSSSRTLLYFESNGTTATNRITCFICNHHICYHWIGILLWNFAQ